MRIVVADHEGGVVTEIDVASMKLDGVEVEGAEVLLARLDEPPAAAGGYDPLVRLHEIGNTYCERNQRFVVSFVNGEPEDDPDPDPDEPPIDTPAAALRRTLQFLGSSDGYQNHWFVFDRQQGTLLLVEQGRGGVALVAEDAPTSIELPDDAALVEHVADEHPGIDQTLPNGSVADDAIPPAVAAGVRLLHDQVHQEQCLAHVHDQPGRGAR
jgi:hypothetical protein